MIPGRKKRHSLVLGEELGDVSETESTTSSYTDSKDDHKDKEEEDPLSNWVDTPEEIRQGTE